MFAKITPENVNIALLAIIAGPFLILSLIELLSGHCLSHRGFMRIVSKEDDSGEYWFNVLLHMGIVCFFIWLCFFKLSPS